MAEKDLWATMRDQVKKHGHFERLENMVGVGRPDVNYCVRRVEGNIELKWAERWPARANVPLALPHYTPRQRNWHRVRLSAGGRVYVLLEVMRPRPGYYLFHGDWARQHLGLDATQADCQAAALVQQVGYFPTDALIAALTGAFSTV
jgi:xanthine/CO dehydrogenase XdhC/CoxF family maturation factor